MTGEDPRCLGFIYFSAGGNEEKETETDGSERICEIVNPPIKRQQECKLSPGSTYQWA